MVQQIPYAQEIKNIMDLQEVEAGSFLKTLHSYINKENLLRVGGKNRAFRVSKKKKLQKILSTINHFTKVVFQQST